MLCGNLGTTELLIILILLLLLFGAKKLPALAKSIGIGITEFKKGLSGLADNDDLADHDVPNPKNTKKHTNKRSSKS